MNKFTRSVLVVATLLGVASVSLPVVALAQDSGDQLQVSDTLSAQVKAAAAKGDSAAVAALAKANPGLEAEIAGIAASSDPDNAADYAGAVAEVAPADQADEIAAAVAAVDPDDARAIAVAVIKAQPDAEGSDIVAAVAEATDQKTSRFAQLVAKAMGKKSQTYLHQTARSKKKQQQVAKMLKRLSKLNSSRAAAYRVAMQQRIALLARNPGGPFQGISVTDKILVNNKGQTIQASNDGSGG